MTRALVRWTIGGTKARALSAQALDLLDVSIGFGKLVMERAFSSVDFLVCHNNLTLSILTDLKRIAKKHEVEFMDVSTQLPRNLINHDVKNSWWKYAPPRIDLDAFEMMMDNDVVLWRLPRTLRKAWENNAMVALTDAAGRYYGDYSALLDRIDPGLKLNAGLVGLPPGLEVDLSKMEAMPLTDFFHTEQGFTAMNFVQFNGPKLLIPLSEIQQLMVNRIAPDILMTDYAGGHFCGCSYGHFDYWERSYSEPLKRLLKKEELF